MSKVKPLLPVALLCVVGVIGAMAQIEEAGPGEKVAFTLGGDIWVMTPENPQPTRLTSSGNAWMPAWSPDGRWLACVSNWKIWAIDPESRQRVAIYAGSDGEYPAWSPDGGTVAFSRFYHLEPEEEGGEWRWRSELWAANADGEDPRMLLALPDAGEGEGLLEHLSSDTRMGDLQFSPDGTLLAFARHTEAKALYIAALDDPAHPMQADVIAVAEPYITDYCWLDDSEYLLAADGGSEGLVGSGLNIVEAVTGIADALVPHPYGIETVDYSAGSQVAVVSWRDGDPWYMSTDGTKQWRRDDVCLVELSEGRVRSGVRPYAAWEQSVSVLASLPEISVDDVQLGERGENVYVLTGVYALPREGWPRAAHRLYRIGPNGEMAVLAEGVVEMAVWTGDG